jgi:hypothetical protein
MNYGFEQIHILTFQLNLYSYELWLVLKYDNVSVFPFRHGDFFFSLVTWIAILDGFRVMSGYQFEVKNMYVTIATVLYSQAYAI